MVNDPTEIQLLNQLQLCTTLITNQTTDSGTKKGTGFFFSYTDSAKDNYWYPTLVTNKHVIEDADTIYFSLTMTSTDGTPMIGKTMSILHPCVQDYLIMHPSEDLAILLLTPIVKDILALIAFRCLPYDMILSRDRLNLINVAHDVIMIGYPLSIRDESNNFPIFRRGMTATNPAADFNDRPEFVIDIGCFPGSSGSPIFAYSEQLLGLGDNGAGIYGKSFAFLGIQQSAFIYNSEGALELPNNQSLPISTAVSANLGLAIRADVLNYFKKPIHKLMHTMQ